MSTAPPAPAPVGTTPAPRAPGQHPGWWGNRLTTLLLVALLVAWSLHATGVGPAGLLAGRDQGVRLLTGLLRPDLSGQGLRTVAAAAVETLQISLAGLALSVVLAVPLGLVLAAPGGAPSPVRAAVRAVATVLRGVPELVWALVFVATVGLGPAAGVYALALHGAGLLAKLWAEQLEAVEPGPVEALRLTGASRGAVLALAVLPQARAGLVSLTLYQWECNVRTATVLGFVGAGGLGQAVDLSLRLFDYGRLSTTVLAVLALVLGVDAVSRRLRARAGAQVRGPG